MRPCNRYSCRNSICCLRRLGRNCSVLALVGDTIAPFFSEDSLGWHSARCFGIKRDERSVHLNMLLEVFRQVPIELGEASLSLGAKWETMRMYFFRKGASDFLPLV